MFKFLPCVAWLSLTGAVLAQTINPLPPVVDKHRLVPGSNVWVSTGSFSFDGSATGPLAGQTADIEKDLEIIDVPDPKNPVNLIPTVTFTGPAFDEAALVPFVQIIALNNTPGSPRFITGFGPGVVVTNGTVRFLGTGASFGMTLTQVTNLEDPLQVPQQIAIGGRVFTPQWDFSLIAPADRVGNYWLSVIVAPVSAIPSPSVALLLGGAGLVGAGRRRRVTT